jgi:GNAT superfamily N-acetyltransferase
MNENTVRIEHVEQPLSVQVSAKIVALWKHEDAVISDHDERLSEVVALAWDGDILAGVSSAGVILHDGVDQPLFTLRTIVSSGFRRQGISYQLYHFVVELLEERFDRGEDTRGIGFVVDVEAVSMINLKEVFCSFSHTHSVQNRPVQFNLVGITESGYPQFIYYFEHASLFADGPVFEAAVDKLAPDPGLDLNFCWNKLTSAEEQQIIGLWLSWGVIADRESCLARLPQVAALAWEDGKIVASIFKTPYETAKTSLMGFRSFVSPDAKGAFVATKLLDFIYQEFNKIYLEHPVLKDMHGMAYVLQNDQLNKNVHMARGPDVGSCLAGYIEKLQLRVKYFEGASIKID